MVSKIQFFCGLVLVLLVVVACSPTLHIRGNLPEENELSKIQAGVHTKEQVLKVLGPPSTNESFSGDCWVYIGEKTSDVAFFRPTVLKRHITFISFDDKGVVTSVVTDDEHLGETVEAVERVTPTMGRDPSLFKEIFGSVGRPDAAKHQRGGRAAQYAGR